MDDITLSTKTVREGSQARLCIHGCVCCDSSLPCCLWEHLAICSMVFLDFEAELSGL